MMAAPQGRALTLAILVGAAACAHPTPRVAPSPPPSITPAAPAQTPERAASPADSSPRVTATAPRADTAVSTAEIATRAVELFGDSLAARAAGDSADDAGPSWDIDVRSYETHDRVERYVARFAGGAREDFTEWLSRGSRYEPLIRAKLHEHGIPEDMVYLALVESGFDPNAYSRAAAVGMWQFMATTAREAGLRVDWWVDERRDPIKSTDAAVRFLAELREQFGSLYLAAAAYNGGPGRVARGLSRFADDLEGTSGDDCFFALAAKDYLPSDTKNYVPQIIAAALIAKDPERYGIHPRTLPPYAYDSARVAASTPLSAVAKAAGVPLDEVVELNPHLLRGVTPPDGAFTVRVPVGKGDSLATALAALDPDERRAFERVETKKGETVASIAKREGVETRQLAWFNPKLTKTKKGALSPGQTVLVPTRAVLAGARDIPDPSVEIYHRASASRSEPVVHTVRRGETLSGLAKKYHTTVPELARLNHLHKHVIYAGQEMIVRAGTRSSAAHTRVAPSRRSGGDDGERPAVKSSKRSTSSSKSARTSSASSKAKTSKANTSAKRRNGSGKPGAKAATSTKKTK
jgi:membrane-bound lytic murein transglycosylase D